MRAAAGQLFTTGAVPVGPGVRGGRVDAVPLDRIAGVLPIGQAAAVAADVAVAVGLQGLACGGRALAVPVGRVDDDLVVAAQLPQGAAGAREPQRARDMPGPEGPSANRHDELDVLSGVQLGLELLPGDRPHRWDLSLGASATDDPLTPRAVSAARHLRAVPRSTR